MSQVTPDRLDRIERILEAVAQQQQVNTEAIGQLSAEVKAFVSTQEAIIENAETDREAFQAEIRRIWEYLLSSSGNGHSSG